MYVGRAVARRGTVVVLPEDIDLINATRMAEQLTLAVGHGSTTIIDMTATTFCDCAGSVPSYGLTSVPPTAAPSCAW
jgi:anti-anti-sigma regulatory factor